jgi:hypothetical protein
MTCGQCGKAIVLAAAQKVYSRDVCPHCESDLHTCQNCRHFDRNAHNQCLEVMAEWVRTKDRNNYCDYFSGADRQGGSAPAAGANVRDQFDSLFKK